jgi:hypothetical protein
MRSVHIVVSDQAGRSNLLTRLRDIGIEVAGDEPKVAALLELVKQRECDGYSYSGCGDCHALQIVRSLRSRTLTPTERKIVLPMIKIDVIKTSQAVIQMSMVLQLYAHIGQERFPMTVFRVHAALLIAGVLGWSGQAQAVTIVSLSNGQVATLPDATGGYNGIGQSTLGALSVSSSSFGTQTSSSSIGSMTASAYGNDDPNASVRLNAKPDSISSG